MPREILAQIEDWRKRLLDLTKRNRLVNCRIGTRGVLRLEHPNTESLWQSLLAGKTLTFITKRSLFGDEIEDDDDEEPQLSLFGSATAEASEDEDLNYSVEDCLRSPALDEDDILTTLSDKKLASWLNRLSLTARTFESEQGLHVLYVAFGLVRWYEKDESDVSYLSPLLLVPVQLDSEGVTAPWKLSLHEEDVVGNHSLKELFKRDYRIAIPEPDCEKLLNSPEARSDYLNLLRHRIAGQHRWEVLDDAVIGQFSFQKLAMYEDYGANAAEIASHSHCRRIAGDESVGPPETFSVCSPGEFDEKVHPRQLHSILPCDSSQLEAILVAKSGESMVLDGPPGTGKSQTIANIIAEAIVSGQSVLFVSEKAAALDVVRRRLADHNLGDFVLNCHSHKARKQEIIEELGRCLQLDDEQYAEHSRDLDRLFELRAQLNSYVSALHRPATSMNLTAYQVHGRLVSLGEGPVSRWSSSDICSFAEERRTTIGRALERLDEFREILRASVQYPWYGCLIESYTLTVQDEISERFPKYAASLDDLASIGSALSAIGLCDSSPTLVGLRAVLDRIEKLSSAPILPASWLEATNHPRIWSIIDLSNEVTSYRAHLADLREFSDRVIDHADCVSQCQMLFDGKDEWTRHVRGLSTGTLRTSVDVLRQLAADFRELATVTRRWAEAASEVGRAIGLPINNLTLGAMSVVKELAATLVETGPLRSLWFDAPNAQRLREAIGRVAQVDRQLVERRAALLGRLSPLMFESEGKQLALDAGDSQVFWRWLLPSWWKLRRKLCEFYREGESVTDAVLFRDMAELRRCHRDGEYVSNELQSLEQGLIRNANGNIDWDTVQRGLDSATRLGGIVQLTPQLIAVLCTDNRVNRDRLKAATAALNEAASQYDVLVKALSERCSRFRPEQDQVPFQRQGPVEYADWLTAAGEAIGERANRLTAVVRLLRSESDLSGNLLAERMHTIEELVSWRATVRRLHSAVRDLVGDHTEPEGHDWRTMESNATFLQSLLKTQADELTDAWQSILCNSERKQHAIALQKKAQAVLDQSEPDRSRALDFFPDDRTVAENVVLRDTSISSLAQWLRGRVSSIGKLREWVDYALIERRLLSCGGEVLLSEIKSGAISIEDAPAAFQRRFYQLWLDAVYSSVDALRQFRLEDHQLLLNEFKDLDRKSIQFATGRIRQSLLGNPDRPHAEISGAPPTSELGVLQREVNKKKKHLPIRQLFAKIPNLLMRMKPCLMMSPLAVSTYLNSPAFRFQLVIFDEASQILPWDAIGAIYRGKQLVVAGDQKQLPPSTFFDRLSDDGSDGQSEEDDSLGDYESVLDVLSGTLKRKRLRWHYRSRREPLIAFSNRHFYDDELVTFPSPDDLNGSTAVRFVHVENGRWKPKAGFNAIEARRLAELVIKQFENDPSSSLGVIALNQRQQLAILDELATLRSGRPDLEDMFSAERREPFFVKNLENVQGDERDQIILGITYGPSEDTGQLAMRFGPLNNEGGERRLNVAVTRARSGITVVSSIRGDQIDLSRSNKVGVSRLKAYLDFAEKGPISLAAAVTGTGEEAESPFEEAVAKALKDLGLNVQLQVGCSGYRIDIGVVHPTLPGKFVLGIECDGAAYHRTATARDRDRMRQEVLEGLGWNIVRVWSTDWLREPKRQVDRIVDYYTKSLETSATTPVQERRSEAERPVIRIRDFEDSVYTPYKDINDVPKPVIELKLNECVAKYGATPHLDLVKAVARSLGFQRTGTRILNRIQATLDSMISKGGLKRLSDGRVSAS